jgi:hypothetical protein
MSKEAKLLLISIVLVILGAVVLVLSARECDTIEYQDLDGTHTMQICEGVGE